MPRTYKRAIPCSWCGGDSFRRLLSSGRSYCSVECGRAALAANSKKHGFTREALEKRWAAMRTNNPSKRSDVRAKVSASLRQIGHRPRVRGGNGTGNTLPQQMLADALGWPTEVVVATRMPRSGGWPRHYKIDIANERLKVAIEVDGNSHCALARKAQDRRKEEFLRSHGWTVLRFSNQQVISDMAGCLSSISRFTGTETSSPTAS